MRNRIVALTGVLAVAIAVTFLIPIRMAGQARKAAAKPYTAPRTPDGHPDLQGTYDLATLTPLERPAPSSGRVIPLASRTNPRPAKSSP